VEALKWALWEMERRYKLFAKGQRTKEGVSRVFRNIEQYRAFLKDNPDTGMEHLPYIVIIIDELADLMLTAPEEVETSLCRLAQLARATGIHLVVATQRPSVDVVTGLIKANFPARAAFAVTSQVDSKVILDQGGAEKLLGRGDMLYTASDESKPVRIQGTFVSDAESERVVNFWRRQLPSPEELADNGIQAPVQPMPMPDWLGTGDPDEESELLEQAIELVKRNNYVSVSMIQRKLRVGYNRAARLIEQMEEMGLIAPADGDNRGRPREVLLGTPDHRAFSFEAEEPDRTRT
jgi:S-DNA-T family DNA segregation ATPase FtsK/SpoIIIE